MRNGTGNPLRVLFVHNFHREPNGEDAAYRAERALLESKGHPVTALEFRNADLDRMSPWQGALSAFRDQAVTGAIAAEATRFNPDIVHFHNNFLRVPPGAYRSCGAAARVQTLHNFRLHCVNSLFFRAGRPCEDCLGKRLPWRGTYRRCYRGSLSASALAAGLQIAHKLGGMGHGVDAYVSLTAFARGRFVAGGMDPRMVHVKANAAPDFGCGSHDGNYCLYAGRLSEEKGIEDLLAAWRILGGGYRLKIAGSGPLEPLLRDLPAGVEFLGQLSSREIAALMRDAKLLLVPSRCYEGFPMTLAEALSAGLPIAASRLGALETILGNESFGWLFPHSDPAGMAATICTALSSPALLGEKGARARGEYEGRYGADAAYADLLGIYRTALMTRATRRD